MCPDPQLLSTYMDGEIPSPWKEKLEKHISECSACREKYGNYVRLKELYTDKTAEEKTIDAAQSRIWRNLALRSKGLRAVRQPRLWQRRLSIPLPAAAAAAVIILLLAGFWLRGARADNSVMAEAYQPQSPQIAGYYFDIDDEENVILPDMDLNSILQFLASDSSTDTIMFTLPDSRNFYRTGEPGAVRAADYQRNTVPGR